MNDRKVIDRPAAKATGPLPANHPLVLQDRIGVLLVNLGTPEATDAGSVRRELQGWLFSQQTMVS